MPQIVADCDCSTTRCMYGGAEGDSTGSSGGVEPHPGRRAVLRPHRSRSTPRTNTGIRHRGHPGQLANVDHLADIVRNRLKAAFLINIPVKPGRRRGGTFVD
ncbi:hypothetical protein ACQPYE_23605 [Actinosynnema sp. CA-299493]